MAIASSSWARAVVDVLTIDHIGHRGDGVALVDGQPVYVPYALPGEQVEVERIAGHPDRRHLVRVDTPSADRIEPISWSACRIKRMSSAREIAGWATYLGSTIFHAGQAGARERCG